MAEQLTIDGRSVPYPTPTAHRLTGRQRELLRFVFAWGEISTREAATFYADPSGALRRLERLGLVKRVSRGRWLP